MGLDKRTSTRNCPTTFSESRQSQFSNAMLRSRVTQIKCEGEPTTYVNGRHAHQNCIRYIPNSIHLENTHHFYKPRRYYFDLQRPDGCADDRHLTG